MLLSFRSMSCRRLSWFFFQTTLALLVICQQSSALRCPKRSSTETDSHNVQGRLDKIIQDLGSTILTSEKHTHKREGSEQADVYDYTFQLCTPENNFGAVYQIETSGDKKKTILGMSNASFALGGENWILIIYRDGKKYKSYCDMQNREAWVKVVCDKSGKSTKLTVLEESRWKNGSPKKGCYYLFELNHKDVCAPVVSKGLSGGVIFIIIFLSLFCAYLLFGFLYQRFVRGAKGVEQMPNYAFWRAFGNLTADGCDFVCRRPDHPTSSYKGMADALDIDSSDDERDDHLLPM